MEGLKGILAVAGIGLVAWLLYRVIRQQPEAFSKENLGKSFGTLGVLGIILIIFISVFVVLLKKG